MRIPGAAAAALALAGALALGGCGGDDEHVSRSPAPDATPQPVQLRLVDAADTDSAPAPGAPATPPPVEASAAYDAFSCPGAATTDEATAYAAACDAADVKYLLEPAALVATPTTATAEVPDEQVTWAVVVTFSGADQQALADLTTSLAGTDRQVALVFEGEVLTAPTVAAPITGGALQIAGDFTQQQAQDLADRLAGRGRQ